MVWVQSDYNSVAGGDLIANFLFSLIFVSSRASLHRRRQFGWRASSWRYSSNIAFS